jgi:hypothetical protein
MRASERAGEERRRSRGRRHRGRVGRTMGGPQADCGDESRKAGKNRYRRSAPPPDTPATRGRALAPLRNGHTARIGTRSMATHFPEWSLLRWLDQSQQIGEQP